MDFEGAVRYLLSLGHETLAIKLGLRNTELLLNALDHPERSFPAVQIAGTNGKGSTATMLDSICRAAGIKCGLYTSPHLVSMTERITVAGKQISPEDFAACATTVREVSEQLLRDKQIEALPTFFEQLTAIALLAFRNAGIKLAILETGLGGRLDATTAAKASIVATTQIAMDHEQYLGHTLESIASEKAAIIRPGVAAVIGKQQPEAMAVLLRRCEETGVTPIIAYDHYTIETTTSDGRFSVTFERAATGYGAETGDADSAETGYDKRPANAYDNVLLGLRGRHQIDNAAVAIRLAELLRVPHAAITSGLEKAEHPGRLELIAHKHPFLNGTQKRSASAHKPPLVRDGAQSDPDTSHHPPFILDGAHNPAGCRALREYLDEFTPRPLTLVFGAMRDKQLDQIAETLFPVADVLILTPVDNPRTASIETLRSLATRFARSTVIETTASAAALEAAIARTPANGLICIAGSLYLIGELRPSILKMKEPT